MNIEGIIGKLPDNTFYFLKLIVVLFLILFAYRFITSLFSSVKASEVVKKSFVGVFIEHFFKRPSMLKEARRYYKEGDLEKAGELYEKAGEITKAEKVYREGQAYFKLAQLYERLGRKKAAAEYYQRAGFLPKAASIYLELEDKEKAAQVYEMNKDYEKAAQLYIDAGKYDKAIEIYEKLGYYNYVGDVYLKKGDNKKAGEYYLKWYYHLSESSGPTGDSNKNIKRYLMDAVELLLKSGEKQKVVSILEEKGYYDKAAEICEEEGKLLEAAEFYELARNYKKAAELYKACGKEEKAYYMLADYYYEQGDNLRAAENYYLAGDYGRAAELFEWEKQYLKAAEAYEKNGNYLFAAENYLKAGEDEKAAEFYSRGGAPEEAADIFKKLNKLKRAAEEYERAEKIFEAAVCYYDVKNYSKALTLFEKIHPEDENYLIASIYKAKILLANGRFEVVIKLATAVLKDSNPTQENVELFYLRGIAYYKIGEYEKALADFSNVETVSTDYKDVQEYKKKTEKAMSTTVTLEGALQDKKKRYRIIDKLGEGGMGIVYKAEDKILNRVVALKILKPHLLRSKKAVQRFYDEARLAAMLTHPNIITIFDVGEMGDGKHYITMEYVEGEEMITFLKRKGKLTIPQILFVAIHLFKALDYAHKKGVIHRDIKPHNIMLTKEKQIKIMDFGLAVLLRESEGDETIAGTPTYMSPEQIRGEKIDYRTDIYSSGITLYHLSAGFPPFRGENVAQMHLYSDPVPLIEVRKDIPKKLNDIIMKCMEKEKNKRFTSVSEILLALRELTKKSGG